MKNENRGQQDTSDEIGNFISGTWKDLALVQPHPTTNLPCVYEKGHFRHIGMKVPPNSL